MLKRKRSCQDGDLRLLHVAVAKRPGPPGVEPEADAAEASGDEPMRRGAGRFHHESPTQELPSKLLGRSYEQKKLLEVENKIGMKLK